LNSLVHLGERFKRRVLYVHVLVCESDGHYNARKVEHVDGGRVAVVLEAVVADSCRGCDWRDDGIDLAAELLLELAQLRKVLVLVIPLLKVGVPRAIDVELGQSRVDEVLEVGDGGLAGLFEGGEDVLTVQ